MYYQMQIVVHLVIPALVHTHYSQPMISISILFPILLLQDPSAGGSSNVAALPFSIIEGEHLLFQF